MEFKFQHEHAVNVFIFFFFVAMKEILATKEEL